MQSPLKRLAPLMVVALLLVVILNAARLSGCGGIETPRKGTVTHVYDGDTLEVSGAGKVRLIGVDALDAHNWEKTLKQAKRLRLSEDEVKEWAERVTQFVRKRVLDREVRLEPGPESRGDYGRLLAYVFYKSNGSAVNLNRLLLKRGLAVAYRRFEHPRRDQFIQVERAAREHHEGLWQEASYH